MTEIESNSVIASERSLSEVEAERAKQSSKQKWDCFGYRFAMTNWLTEEISGAPLVVFRVAFGVLLLFSLIRFWANGWINQFYVQPKFFFPFYGFEFVKPLNETAIYTVFSLMIIATLFIISGYFYRIALIVFFLLFTYVELIDKTTYLNHYYFISLVSFSLCFLPLKNRFVPRWTIFIIQLQMAIVYFYAGIAKINYDWLINAMPLRIWLTTKSHIPVVGFLFDEKITAYIFSWFGMFFDTFIAFFLFNKKTVKYAYILVVIFHVLTAILFPMIGVFPFVMIVGATIFLPAEFHEKLLRKFNKQFAISKKSEVTAHYPLPIAYCLLPFFLIQILFPLRSHFYAGNLFYHEQGFRFSWRVMLMEKAGIVFFRVKDANGKMIGVNNRDFLTRQQEFQMRTQPDMILQFAHHLAEVYKTDEVYAESYVSVNGHGSKLMIDSTVNLAKEKDGFGAKKWILSDYE
ncbi:MAG TPA: HTTM domain-containing protein [Chitinophagales bacterium]